MNSKKYLTSEPVLDYDLGMRFTGHCYLIVRLFVIFLITSGFEAVHAQNWTSIETSGTRFRQAAYDSSLSIGQEFDKQAATFTFTIKPNQINPDTLVEFVSVQWVVNGNQQSSTFLTSDTTTIHVGVGKTTISANVNVVVNGIPQTDSPQTAVVVLGGPVSVGFIRESASDRVPTNDTGPTPTLTSAQPFYLQYLGFDPTMGIPDGNVQVPQTGDASVAGSAQPTGTTYKWTVTGPLSFFPGINSSSNQVSFAANGSSTSGQASIHCTFTYVDSDPELSGTADDDSATTPPPTKTSANPSYYTFTCHMPSFITVNVQNPNHLADPEWTPGSASIAVKYENILFDTLSMRMPGVWINERFPNGTGGLNVNSDSNYWTTIGVSKDDVGTPGSFGKKDGLSKSGWSEDFDTLGLAVGWTYEYSSTPRVGPITQQYFAGTKSVSVTDFGILIRAFSNSFWCDRIIHAAP